MAEGKKNAARLGAHLVFADESGFLLTPTVAKTWAPIGQTPVIRHFDRRDRISVISGISVSPRRQRLNLFFQLHLQEHSTDRSVLLLAQPSPSHPRPPVRPLGRRPTPQRTIDPGASWSRPPPPPRPFSRIFPRTQPRRRSRETPQPPPPQPHPPQHH